MQRNSTNVGDALRLMREGQRASGLSLYRQLLATNPLAEPIGIHAKLLESSGLEDEADALRRLGLLWGADLGTTSLLPTARPESVAREYEALFEQGWINSWMVSRYLVALSRLRRTEDLRNLLDPGRVVVVDDLHGPSSSASSLEIPQTLECEILGREPEAVFEAESQSVRSMHNLTRLDQSPSDALGTLISEIRRRVSSLISTRHPLEHKLQQWVPERFEVSMWSLTSRGYGFNVKHVHHRGWYTGVYYVTGVPEEVWPGGALCIGRPDDVDAKADGWPELTIRPQPGLLVLMPSYFTHWTVPMGQPGLRISIAFDVLSQRESEA